MRKGDGAASPTRRGASPTRAAAASPAAGGGAEAEEERPLTFAERNPLVMPKCISGFEKKAGADKFLKKTMEGVEQTKRKKKHADDDIAAKAVTGLAADLDFGVYSKLERVAKPDPAIFARAAAKAIV